MCTPCWYIFTTVHIICYQSLVLIVHKTIIMSLGDVSVLPNDVEALLTTQSSAVDGNIRDKSWWMQLYNSRLLPVQELAFEPTPRQINMVYIAMFLPALAILITFMVMHNAILAIMTLHIVCFVSVPVVFVYTQVARGKFRKLLEDCTYDFTRQIVIGCTIFLVSFTAMMLLYIWLRNVGRYDVCGVMCSMFLLLQANPMHMDLLEISRSFSLPFCLLFSIPCWRSGFGGCFCHHLEVSHIHCVILHDVHRP